MSDHGKPIDTLPTKDATDLNLLDALIGVSSGGEPAAFQAQLGEVAQSSDFLDALAAGLISRIIGQVETNPDGSFIRLENGLQLCWKNHQIPASVAVNVANSGWG